MWLWRELDIVLDIRQSGKIIEIILMGDMRDASIDSSEEWGASVDKEEKLFFFLIRRDFL